MSSSSISVRRLLEDSQYLEQEVLLQAWARTRRDSKAGFSFIELNDGSCQANLQALAASSLANYKSEVLHIYPGTSLKIEGKLVRSPGKEQGVELQVNKLEILGHCDPATYPIGKQRMSFEALRDYAHLRPRTNTFGAITRLRNHLSQSIHQFFQAREFYWVHTPIITPSDAEGAGKVFHVTSLDLDRLPKQDSQVDFTQDFFGKPVNLTVSGQLEGEAYACAVGKVYTFGPTFRAENSNTSRHLAEFWMVEPEQAFCDLDQNADLAETFLKHLFGNLLVACPQEMKFFNERVDKEIIALMEKLASVSFTRMTYTEAVEKLRASKEPFTYPVEWGIDLQSEHERWLTEKYVAAPVILTDYPKGIKAFYMKQNDDEKTVRAMDVLVPKIGEIIGGSQREDDLHKLEGRMDEMKIPKEELQWYLDLRRFGSVPHAGFGLGFERLVQFCSGMTNIRDVIPFPRTPGNARF